MQGKTEALQQQPEPWQTPSRPGRRRRAKEAFKVTTHNRFGATEEIQVNTWTSGTIYITSKLTSFEFFPEYGVIEKVLHRLPIRVGIRELGAGGPGVAAQREGATTILGPRLLGKTEKQVTAQGVPCTAPRVLILGPHSWPGGAAGPDGGRENVTPDEGGDGAERILLPVSATCDAIDFTEQEQVRREAFVKEWIKYFTAQGCVCVCVTLPVLLARLGLQMASGT